MQPPKNATAKRKQALARAERPSLRPYTFNLPPDLIAAIDAIATEDRRSRVRTVEVALAEFVREHRRSRETAA
jgi:hypothetical protein